MTTLTAGVRVQAVEGRFEKICSQGSERKGIWSAGSVVIQAVTHPLLANGAHSIESGGVGYADSEVEMGEGGGNKEGVSSTNSTAVVILLTHFRSPLSHHRAGTSSGAPPVRVGNGENIRLHNHLLINAFYAEGGMGCGVMPS